MKSLSILITLLSLISCNQQELEEQLGKSPGKSIALEDITTDVQGTYDLGCRQVTYQKGDQAKITLVIDDNGSKIIEDVYVSSGLPCSNPDNIIYTLEHDIYATVEKVQNAFINGVTVDTSYELVIEGLSSTIETKHITMNNYTCGNTVFTTGQTYNISNEGCDMDKTGESNLLRSLDDINNLEFNDENLIGLKGWEVFSINL